MMQDSSRRNFMRQSAGMALAAGPAILPVLGANGKVNVGFIGGGSRGNYLMGLLYKGNPETIQVTAVCDTYAGHLARAKDRVQTLGKNVPKTYADYRELLGDPSVEVVVIATPEHLHHSMTLAALKANKHIYVEKPLAHTIEEGEEVLKAAAKSDRIVQVGTQNRSNAFYQKAKQLIAEGLIGDVHYVRAFWYRNSLNNDPAWRYVIPADADEQNTDWKRFLGPAPKRPFDKRRYYQWRLYWDYSGGISTDLLVHQTDISNFVCGKTVPLSCMASGGIYRWTDPTDDRDVPDTISAIYEYPGRFHINYSCYFGNDHFGYGEQFLGNEGTIEVISRKEFHFYPEQFKGKAPARVAARKEIHLANPKQDDDAVEAHLKNWIEACRGNGKVIAPPPIGQQAAISGHLATLSYRHGKKVVWDDAARKYRFA
jgi:predicted dehydrogenase